MKCSECEESNQVSKVYMQGGSTTLMAYTTYWDEEGIYHDHDPNTHTRSYTCSNGHSWTIKRINPCPAEGCTHGES